MTRTMNHFQTILHLDLNMYVNADVCLYMVNASIIHVILVPRQQLLTLSATATHRARVAHPSID
jgi:hypothetical protein